MENEDFDLDSLAAYLHLTPERVMRLADRGRIPGRKIAGKWKFSGPEIHHWLEDRIGGSDADELVEMEVVFDRHSDEQPPCIADLMPAEGIQLHANAKTRTSIIAAMTDTAMRTGLLWDAERMADALMAREELHPTALEGGVALLHPRRPLPSIIAEPFITLARTSSGIPFGGNRGELTDLFFLLCSDSDATHLRTLARLSRLLAQPEFLAGLRAAQDGAEVLALIRAQEAELI